MNNDDAAELKAVIETAMQVIVALRWAVQQRAALPASLDLASRDVLDALYEWQRQHGQPAPPADEQGGTEAASEPTGEVRMVAADDRPFVTGCIAYV